MNSHAAQQVAGNDARHIEDDARQVASDARHVEDARCGICGGPLPPATFPPRVTCSDACRRQRQRLTRQLRRRESMLTEWRRPDLGKDDAAYAPTEIARPSAEIAELRQKLGEE